MQARRSLRRRLRPLLALLGLTVASCAGIQAGLGIDMPDELRQRGLSAPAEILTIWDTGWTINDDPVIGMTVKVRPHDRPAFEATIEKTAISRIAIPRFQPGQTLMVRFDPMNPATVAVDSAAAEPALASPSSGNPYRDRLERTQTLGATFLPAPEAPRLYLGTGDSAADVQALYESEFALLGSSVVEHAPDPHQALELGREIGATLVVVYGRFEIGPELEVLPFRRRPAVTGAPASTVALAPVWGLGPNSQAALYWGKTRPAILGIVSRPLDAKEQAELGRKDGILVEGVAVGSPAAQAGLRSGDVVVAIDGQTLGDPQAVPALVSSLAGRTVRVDLIRGGSPLTATVRLNPPSP